MPVKSTAKHRKSALRSIVLAAAVLLTATGCSSQDPHMAQPQEQTSPVVVAYADIAGEQQVLGQIYAHGFARVHREASVLSVEPSARLEAVRTGAATMAFGCSGELLGEINPAKARELAKKFASDSDSDKVRSPKWRDEVYRALSESLPGNVIATDPSNAQGCKKTSSANPGANLPQYIVPFYRVPTMNRQHRVDVLNRIAGSLSTKELSELNDRIAHGEEASSVAENWVATSRFATG